MSHAEKTREAVRDRPALFDALRVGVVNYAAAARWLDVGDDPETVATALRRFENDLSMAEEETRVVRVRTERVEAESDGPIAIGGSGYAPGEGSYTAILATGDVDPRALERVLGVLRTHEVDVDAAGVAGNALSVVVGRRDGADAIRIVERTLEA